MSLVAKNYDKTKGYRVMKASSSSFFDDGDCFNNFLVNLTARNSSLMMDIVDDNENNEYILSQPSPQDNRHFRKLAPPQQQQHHHQLSNIEHIALHKLHISKQDNRFRKSWGNFVNIFDEQGEQKLLLSRTELRNYIVLANHAQPESGLSFYASLFPGNYPKPLYNSATSGWRMRYNFFVGNLFNATTTTDAYHIRLSGDGQSAGDQNDEILLHLGELHIYFNVEHKRKKPVYQNLCFFFDNNLASNFLNKKLYKKGAQFKPIGHLFEDHTFVSRLQARLKECSLQLRHELVSPAFIEQLFFPMHSSRLHSPDPSTSAYFDLRQQDLQTALDIFNQPAPYSFLHSVSIV